MGPASKETRAERAVLLNRLSGQRAHVLERLEGLSDEQLRRSVLPSGWSCLRLERHLTLSDERYWFEVFVAGEPLASGLRETTGTEWWARTSRLRR